MADENGVTESTAITEQNAAENGVIINAEHLQSIDIPMQFNLIKGENGWIANILEGGQISINFITSMRKFETALMDGDTIERDGNDLIIIRRQPADAYRSQRGRSTLAKTREELFSVDTSGE